MTKKHLYLTVSATLFSFLLNESALKADSTRLWCPTGTFILEQAKREGEDRDFTYTYSYSEKQEKGWEVIYYSEYPHLQSPKLSDKPERNKSFIATLSDGKLGLYCYYEVSDVNSESSSSAKAVRILPRGWKCKPREDHFKCSKTH